MQFECLPACVTVYTIMRSFFTVDQLSDCAESRTRQATCVVHHATPMPDYVGGVSFLYSGHNHFVFLSRPWAKCKAKRVRVCNKE